MDGKESTMQTKGISQMGCTGIEADDNYPASGHGYYTVTITDQGKRSEVYVLARNAEWAKIAALKVARSEGASPQASAVDAVLDAHGESLEIS